LKGSNYEKILMQTKEKIAILKDDSENLKENSYNSDVESSAAKSRKIKLDTVNKNKDESIWNIISRRMFKKMNN
jgi:hypothetical protein